LIFLGSLGFKLYGIEVHEQICNTVHTKLTKLGYSSELKVGTNQEIPFPDNYFDFLVSWNVIHYENNEKDIQNALEEYNRILKPGGRMFLSTTGPLHKILLNSKKLGNHRYLIGRDDDFRKGQIFFYFDSETDIKIYFAPFFKKILLGSTHDFLFTETLDWFINTGVK